MSHADASLTSQFNSSAIGFMPPLRDAQWFIKKMSEQYGFKPMQSLFTRRPYAQNYGREPTKVVW